MRTFLTWVERHPLPYLLACLLVGTGLRLALVGAQHFWDPRYPISLLFGGLQ
jgi:hypothetical protein